MAFQDNIKQTSVQLDQIKTYTPAVKVGDVILPAGIGGDFIPGSSQGSSTAFYKCTSVDTSNATWVGRKALLNDGVYSFESDSTTGLAYTAVTPIVGEVYSSDALITASDLYGQPRGSGSIYGVIYDPSSSSPICQRVIKDGDALKQVAAFPYMPAHNFRRCVMDDLANRHINYYLSPFDSNYKEDGTSSVLTGADGDVMVEIPICHWSVTEMQDGKILYLISDQPFTGSEPHPFFYVSPGGATLRKQYVGAYEACLCTSNGEAIALTQDASSPASYSSGYKARSLKGTKPWTNASRATARVAINANGGYQVNALFHQYLMLMCMIEGGSLNTQATISPGYTYANWDYTYTRFSGRCNYGNGTGNLMYDPSQDSNISWQSVNELLKIVQFQYRGIENPWGHVWSFVDGIVKEDGGYYMTTDCTAYTDEGYASTYTWKDHSWQTDNNYVRTFDYKTFFAKSSGGSETTYLTDYFWYASGSRVVLCGGRLNHGAYGGAGCVTELAVLSIVHDTYGFRVSA